MSVSKSRANKPTSNASRWKRVARGWAAGGVVGVILLGAALGVASWLKSKSVAEHASHPSKQDGYAGFRLEDERAVFATYAGSESCRSCHTEAYNLWLHSNHGLAERLPDPKSERIAFEPARSFEHGTQQTGVRVDGTNWLVMCPGLSSSSETHSIARVIGREPLRQFLVGAPGGRLQTLEATYDPRSNEWFNVYGNEDRHPGEWGHWTGRGMNWNNMCAGCHNTRTRKNYDEATDTYRTAMAEVSVGCEACHGPLKTHVDWQKQYAGSGQKDPTIHKFSRKQVMDNCGFCHARRADLTGDFRPGDLFFDHMRLSIVDETDVYYSDGQVREEDYEFASFLSSRMHTNGVTCMDCHQPHSAKTILPGNWLCLRCHNGSYSNAPVINPVAHSFHKVHGFDSNGVPVNVDLMTYNPKEIKETGGECVNCHMPQTVYMQRHWRHDHGFTIPDPLLTKEFGIPNACNRCHADKDVDWSIANVEKRYGARMDRPTRQRAKWIARARGGDPAARNPLLSMLTTDENPYWQAVAVGLLEQWATDTNVRAALIQSVQHTNPLVRITATPTVAPLLSQPDAPVGDTLRKLLNDPVRGVRVAAAWSVRGGLETNSLAASELQHFLNLNADQPTGQLQKGIHHYSHGEMQLALGHLQKAVAWDPNSAPFRHELAVVLSALDRGAEAAQQLEAACRLSPREAEYRYKLALALNETGNLSGALAALQEAVRLNPQHGRAWYNLGLALNATGQPVEAVEALIRAEGVAPADPQIPYARATILVRLNRPADAKAAAARAVEINPTFNDARRLFEALSREK